MRKGTVRWVCVSSHFLWGHVYVTFSLNFVPLPFWYSSTVLNSKMSNFMLQILFFSKSRCVGFPPFLSCAMQLIVHVNGLQSYKSPVHVVHGRGRNSCLNCLIGIPAFSAVTCCYMMTQSPNTIFIAQWQCYCLQSWPIRAHWAHREEGGLTD